MRTLAVMLVLIALAFTSCKIEPQPINYGQDMCVHCMMTIIDPQHAAEGVTEKGKVTKFDAIECMLRHSLQGGPSFRLELVNAYDEPERLFPAAEVTYVVSEALPSPMGAYLSAFADPEKAKSFIEANGGSIFTWNDLKNSDRIPSP